MADLDDFFAKKDRKKSKSVKKFATADELAKKMEDPKQKPEVARPKKERPVQEGEEGGRVREEEEWKEYEEPVKDYTGLKIQVLQGGNNQQESGRDSNSEDGSAQDSGKVKGPWNKPSSGNNAEVEQPAPPPPVEEKKEPKPTSGTYMPPSIRQRPVEPLRHRHQSKHLPDIHNDDYFPMLGAAGGGSAGGAGGAGTRRAGGWSPAPAGPAPQRLAANRPLSTGNRFNDLTDDS